MARIFTTKYCSECNEPLMRDGTCEFCTLRNERDEWKEKHDKIQEWGLSKVKELNELDNLRQEVETLRKIKRYMEELRHSADKAIQHQINAGRGMQAGIPRWVGCPRSMLIDIRREIDHALGKKKG